MDLTLLISSIPLLISSIFLLISSISQPEILKHSRAHSSDICLLSLNPTPQEKHLVFAPELVLNTNSPWRIHNFWPLSRLWILDLNDHLPSGQLQLAVNMHLKPNTSKTQLKPPNTALVSPSQWAGATIRQITQAKNLKIHPLLFSFPHSIANPSALPPKYISNVTTCCCCCSIAQSCPTIRNSHGLHTPGLPVFHHLPELARAHVHWISDAIQPSHLLLSPSPPAFKLSQHRDLFQWDGSSHQVPKALEFQLQH